MWLPLLILLCSVSVEAKLFRVTKAECKSLDLSFCYFKNCELNTNAKGQTDYNFYVGLRYKEPINEVTIGVVLFKVSKSYRIPVLNETVDFCSFMRNALSPTLFHYIAEHTLKYSNVNHTCPYQHDIIVAGREFGLILPDIPAPNGNYIVQLLIGAYKKWKVNIKIYITKDNS